jgi:hypothetical protein
MTVVSSKVPFTALANSLKGLSGLILVIVAYFSVILGLPQSGQVGISFPARTPLLRHVGREAIQEEASVQSIF